MDPAERGEILRKIEERNRRIEDDPKWIEKSYEGLMVRRLTNVSEKEYDTYKKFLDNGAVYIIVHPAFFPFFHDFRRLSRAKEGEGPYSKRNVIEKFLSLTPKDYVLSMLQAQERRTRDFIEFKSTQEKLVILVVPTNYYKYKGYVYRKYADEYMRYLNEISNLSKSVLFVESKSPNRGYVSEDNSIRLMEFLLSIKADEIYLGGGYIGRCLEDFYKYITEDYGSEGIYLIPELSDLSPNELTNAIARELLKPNGEINSIRLTQLLKQDVFKVQEVTPKILNLP